MTDKVRAAKSGIRVRFYRRRNRLKEMVDGGAGGGHAIDIHALNAAAAEFDKMAEDYPDWVQDHIK